MKRTIALASLAVVLAACDNMAAPGAGTPSSPQPTVAPAPAPQPSFSRTFDERGAADLAVVPPASVAQGGIDFVRIAGVPADASPGGLAGPISLRLPNELEVAAATGRTVKVTVSARGDVGSRLEVAYSTNVAGNSGWRAFELTPEFLEYSFEYPTPAHEMANGDYIGFKSEGPVDLKSVSAVVVSVD